jgi:molybdate transport system substrate-binding protein
MRFRLAALVIAFVVSHAAAQVREVRVMSSGATAPAYLQLIQPFEAATKLNAVTLATSNGVGAANIATRVRGGEAVDVLFLSASIMDDMIKEGHVVPATRVDIGRSAIGVGVRAGAKRPDISTVEALTKTFLDAKSIAIPESQRREGVRRSRAVAGRSGRAETKRSGPNRALTTPPA